MKVKSIIGLKTLQPCVHIHLINMKKSEIQFLIERSPYAIKQFSILAGAKLKKEKEIWMKN